LGWMVRPSRWPVERTNRNPGVQHAVAEHLWGLKDEPESPVWSAQLWRIELEQTVTELLSGAGVPDYIKASGSQVLEQHVRWKTDQWASLRQTVTAAIELAPFDGFEFAAFALCVPSQVGGSCLDLFGLMRPGGGGLGSYDVGEVPWFRLGEMVYVQRGSPMDKAAESVLKAAKTFWHQFAGIRIQGRPPGRALDLDSLKEKYRRAALEKQSDGGLPTQDDVAFEAGIDKKTLRRVLNDAGSNWQELRKTSF
jgi:hypothetical protein